MKRHFATPPRRSAHFRACDDIYPESTVGADAQLTRHVPSVEIGKPNYFTLPYCEASRPLDPKRRPL